MSTKNAKLIASLPIGAWIVAKTQIGGSIPPNTRGQIKSGETWPYRQIHWDSDVVTNVFLSDDRYVVQAVSPLVQLAEALDDE